MGVYLTIRVALRALIKNKLRAGLTILGVVIGIAAVTTMVSIGQSASQLVQNEFSNFGSNMLIIFPGSQSEGAVHRGAGKEPTLTPEDVDAIGEECLAVAAISPLVFTSGQLVYGNSNWSPREMKGIGPGYLTVRKLSIRRGAFITERDIASASQVCVIGHTIAKQLFQTMNPVGETIRIANIPFRVIGELAAKGANIVGEDQDDVVLMPFTTVGQRIYQTRFRNVGAAVASATSNDRMRQAERQIRQLLIERHRIAPGNPPDFTVQNTTEIANAFGKVTGIMTMLLASIAAISLLVGGVGIMNIMLVSVTERTREIGIRMAVGASSGDILRQFLVEAVVLSMFGGMIGFGLGVGASVGLTKVINSFTPTEWPTVISVPAGILAVVFSALVGMFFGFYPARRASRLDPIEALRYE
jgi:putative ABC transport system permease protein